MLEEDRLQIKRWKAFRRRTAQTRKKLCACRSFWQAAAAAGIAALGLRQPQDYYLKAYIHERVGHLRVSEIFRADIAKFHHHLRFAPVQAIKGNPWVITGKLEGKPLSDLQPFWQPL